MTIISLYYTYYICMTTNLMHRTCTEYAPNKKRPATGRKLTGGGVN